MPYQHDSSAADPYNVEATNDTPACSSMDCTGLIPALPQDEFELESYEALYPFLSPVVKEEQAAVMKQEDFHKA